MNYKYNELAYAEKVYNEGLQTKYVATELRLVATYMRRILEYKPKKVKQELYAFCEKHIPEFNRATYFKLLNKAINSACKANSTLTNITEVPIYKWEFDYINNCELELSEDLSEWDYECRKTMFTFLIQMKLNQLIYEQKNGKEYVGKYFQGGKKEYNDLKKMANLSPKTRINEDIIYALAQADQVTILFNGLIQLNFIERMGLGGSFEAEEMFKVKDFENVGLYFDYYNSKKNVALCNICEQPFRRNGNKQIYCKNCVDKVSYSSYEPQVTKFITCVDCGQEFEISSYNTKTNRCADCEKKHRRMYNAQKQREYRMV